MVSPFLYSKGERAGRSQRPLCFMRWEYSQRPPGLMIHWEHSWLWSVMDKEPSRGVWGDIQGTRHQLPGTPPSGATQDASQPQAMGVCPQPGERLIDSGPWDPTSRGLTVGAFLIGRSQIPDPWKESWYLA